MDYPRVTQLEQQMLGKTFVNESVSQRLVRLENKAFGAVSSSDDLSSRTDALAQYAQFFTESQPAKSTAVAETAPTTTVKSPVRSSAVAEAVPTTGYVLNLNAPVQYRKAYRTW
jgi:propanediol utilization protein